MNFYREMNAGLPRAMVWSCCALVLACWAVPTPAQNAAVGGASVPAAGVGLTLNGSRAKMGGDGVGEIDQGPDASPDLEVLVEGPGPVVALAGLETIDAGVAGPDGTPGLDADLFVEPVLARVRVDLDIQEPSGASVGTLLVGPELLMAPYSGGCIVPDADIAIPLVRMPDGEWQMLLAAKTTVPPGLTVYMQAWFDTPAAPQAVTASNGIVVTFF